MAMKRCGSCGQGVKRIRAKARAGAAPATDGNQLDSISTLRDIRARQRKQGLKTRQRKATRRVA